MADWHLWEVFARAPQALAHRHMGSVQAPDAELALQHARDVFTRRGETVSLWLVAASDLVISDDQDNQTWFASGADKACRHPAFYPIPEGVDHL